MIAEFDISRWTGDIGDPIRGPEPLEGVGGCSKPFRRLDLAQFGAVVVLHQTCACAAIAPVTLAIASAMGTPFS